MVLRAKVALPPPAAMTDKELLYLSEPESEEEEGSDLPFFIQYPRSANLLLVILYAGVGILYFVTVLGWSPETSFYAVAQILTTVGYGDLPFGEVKGFVTAYVLVGLAIVANVMNDIFNEVLNSAEDQFSKNVHRAGHFLNADSDSDAAPAHSRRCAQWRDLLHALLTYIFLVCAWVLFFRNYEACSCSYGITGVEDCDLERCVDTGGSTLSYREAVYEAVITFATVGFGDYSPKSRLGRVLGGILMIFGVLAFATLVGSIASLLDAFKDSYKKKLRVSPQVFHAIDLNGSGVLGKGEFRSYMLLREGKVSLGLLATIDKLFDSIDRNGNGSLSFDEINEAEKKAALFYQES